MAEDPLDAKMAEDLLDAKMAEDPLDAKMAEDLLDVMVETEEARVVLKIVGPIAKTDLQNVNQENLEPLENHVETALDMHITAHQNLYSNLTERIRG
jgi:CRISPR/Cas system CMR-associated protein Cmr5 small subunit